MTGSVSCCLWKSSALTSAFLPLITHDRGSMRGCVAYLYLHETTHASTYIVETHDKADCGCLSSCTEYNQRIRSDRLVISRRLNIKCGCVIRLRLTGGQTFSCHSSLSLKYTSTSISRLSSLFSLLYWILYNILNQSPSLWYQVCILLHTNTPLLGLLNRNDRCFTRQSLTIPSLQLDLLSLSFSRSHFFSLLLRPSFVLCSRSSYSVLSFLSLSRAGFSSSLFPAPITKTHRTLQFEPCAAVPGLDKMSCEWDTFFLFCILSFSCVFDQLCNVRLSCWQCDWRCSWDWNPA